MSLTSTLASTAAALTLAASSLTVLPASAAVNTVPTSIAPTAVNVVAPMWIHRTVCELLRPIYRGC